MWICNLWRKAYRRETVLGNLCSASIPNHKCARCLSNFIHLLLRSLENNFGLATSFVPAPEGLFVANNVFGHHGDRMSCL